MAGNFGPVDTADPRGNGPEYITQAADYLKRSPQRRAVFAAIYQNQSPVKTVDYLKQKTGFGQVRVLQLAGELEAHGLVTKAPTAGAYRKIKFFAKNYRRILDLASNPKKIAKIATKRSVARGGVLTLKVNIPTKASVKEVFIDELFPKVRNVRPVGGKRAILPESKVKAGMQAIIGESGVFKDWPGEKSDLYTTKMRLNGKRIAAALAFKGRATGGKLTPGKMGKHGDQISRLFEEPAGLFLIVYDGQVDTYVKTQMRAAATYQAARGQKIYYGVIDGDDLRRLYSAYSSRFV